MKWLLLILLVFCILFSCGSGLYKYYTNFKKIFGLDK